MPEQTLAGALADVERALALAPTHLSFTSSLEPNTAFAAAPATAADDDDAWDMQEACQARLAAAGCAQYETSAYAQPGRQCRHNRVYWGFGDYLGIGAGAHGKITQLGQPSGERAYPRAAVSAHTTPADASSTAAIERHGPWRSAGAGRSSAPNAYLAHAGTGRAVGGDDDDAGGGGPEFMLNALRLREGRSRPFEARTGLPRAVLARLAQASERGWLDDRDGRIAPTELGQRFLNDVIALFLPDTPRARARLLPMPEPLLLNCPHWGFPTTGRPGRPDRSTTSRTARCCRADRGVPAGLR